MLRHPFHGIIGLASKPTAPPADRPPRTLARRGFFAQSLGALLGAGAWLFTRSSPAQTPWDGGRGLGFPEGGALQGGYGGGIRFPPREGMVTTYAIGEEGGYYPPPRRRRPRYGGPVTTYAIGEEGGFYPPPPRYTTQAIGEEGGYYPGW